MEGNAKHTHAIFGVVVNNFVFLCEMGEIQREMQTGEPQGQKITAGMY
jgi:hypothetical protein